MRRSSLVTAIKKLAKNKRDKPSNHRRGSDSSYSDISSSSESSDGYSSSETSPSRRSSGRNRRRNDRDHSSKKEHKRRSGGRKDRRRGRERHHDDAEKMADLLARLLPFYGTGDYSSDALVIDTIHRLPPHALELRDQNGTTLLLMVCQFAAYDLLPTLLSKGCDVNATNNAGATPLHFACFSDTFSPESAMTLVRHGAVAESVESDWGCTPLHWAAFSGHVELCRVLCIAGASPSTKDAGGNDPISYSKQSGNAACTAMLESFREDVMGNEGNLRWDRMIDGSTGKSLAIVIHFVQAILFIPNIQFTCIRIQDRPFITTKTQVSSTIFL